MKIIPILGALLLSSFILQAQEFTLRPTWEKGDSWEVAIYSENPQDKESLEVSRWTAEWKILDKDKTGYLFSWRYTSFQLDTAFLSEDQLQSARLRYAAAQGPALLYRTTLDGNNVELQNPEIFERIATPFLKAPTTVQNDDDDWSFAFDKDENAAYIEMAKGTFMERIDRIHSNFGHTMVIGQQYDIKDLDDTGLSVYDLDKESLELMGIIGTFGLILEGDTIKNVVHLSIDMSNFFQEFAGLFEALESLGDAFDEASFDSTFPADQQPEPREKKVKEEAPKESFAVPVMKMQINGVAAFDQQSAYPYYILTIAHTEIEENAVLEVVDASDITTFKKMP